jgi:hypothetical protein
MVNRATMTAAMIDSREFINARRRADAQVLLPTGTRVAFAGGVDCNDHQRIWAALDKVMHQAQGDNNTTLTPHPGRPCIGPRPSHPLRGKEDPVTTFNIYRVRFIQSQRYAININAPSAELAEFFAEEIRKRAGTTPFEAIGEPFGGPRWTIAEALANALARAKAQGSVP